MEIIRLRTLALGSTMNFGKYANLTVERLIELGKLGYLRWTYFNLSKINYNEEVLRILRITEGYQISKPGKNKAMFDKLEKVDRIGFGRRPGSKSEAEKAFLKGGEYRRNKTLYSKSCDQARNQGRL